MAQNHGRDPLEVHLGANGVPLGKKKMGQNRKKITKPQNSNFWLPRSHRFFAKNGIWGHAAKLRIFDYSAVIDFSQNMEVTVIGPNDSEDPLGSILVPMGPIG